MTGSVGQARVPPSFLEHFPLALPDVETQKDVVRRLDGFMQRASTASSRLFTAASILQGLRKAAIVAGATGQLTMEWRRNLHRIDSDGAPAKWTETTIGGISECLDSRRRPVNAEERAKRRGNVPYFGANGQVGWIDEPLFDEPLVLVVEDETFIGRTKPFSYSIQGPSWVNNHAHVLRPRPFVSAETLNLALSYYNFVPLTSGTTGRRKLTQAALLQAPLFVPPVDEQAEIVSRVEAMLTRIDNAGTHLVRATHALQDSRESAVSKAYADHHVET